MYNITNIQEDKERKCSIDLIPLPIVSQMTRRGFPEEGGFRDLYPGTPGTVVQAVHCTKAPTLKGGNIHGRTDIYQAE